MRCRQAPEGANDDSYAGMPVRLTPIGRSLYAIGLLGIGIRHFIFRDFVPVILPYWPSWIPGRRFWACVVGAALISAGTAILLGIKTGPVAAILGGVFLALVLAAQVLLQLAADPLHLGVWSNAFKELALCGGAWVWPVRFKNQGQRKRGMAGS